MASGSYSSAGCLWHRYGEFSIFDWSVSGNETCVVVHGSGFRLALDIGVCPPQAVDADLVFVSHGHVDHCGALHSHIRKRQLAHLPPATYFVPTHLLEPLAQVAKLFALMQGDPDAAEPGTASGPVLVGVKPGDEFPVSGRGGCPMQLRVFATDHRVPSVGCLLRRQRQDLLPRYRGLPTNELRALVSAGVAVRQPVWEPLLAYTGDTRFSVFLNPPDPELLSVRLLVTELTYLDGPLDKAEKYGHTHIKEFACNWQLFSSIGHLVFVHFSNRYAPNGILELVYSWLHPNLGNRVYCGLNAKRLLYF